MPIYLSTFRIKSSSIFIVNHTSVSEKEIGGSCLVAHLSHSLYKVQNHTSNNKMFVRTAVLYSRKKVKMPKVFYNSKEHKLSSNSRYITLFIQNNGLEQLCYISVKSKDAHSAS